MPRNLCLLFLSFIGKHARVDKKLSISLENEILDYLDKSSDSDDSSPPELLSSRSSRRTVIYLILALYHMYPDYDFRNGLKPVRVFLCWTPCTRPLMRWSFNFFFYNRKLKRIVTFRFGCFSNLVSDGYFLDETNNVDSRVIFAIMDT
ncbi:hypothetical protein RIF29_15288 [Crotalaria pallida]|uniref:Uncharacterized protein n=1 Tax=Crotalaria pallida TaxID=3830 RepID=A0AAN9ICG7_CROPI